MAAMTKKRWISPTSHPSKLHRRIVYAASQSPSNTPIAPRCVIPMRSEQIESMLWGMDIEMERIMQKAQTNLMNWKKAVLDMKELNLSFDENEFERKGGEITWNKEAGATFDKPYNPEFEEALAEMLVQQPLSKNGFDRELIDTIRQWPEDIMDSHIAKDVADIKEMMAAIDQLPKFQSDSEGKLSNNPKDTLALFAQVYVQEQVSAMSVGEIKDWFNLHDWTDYQVRDLQAQIKTLPLWHEILKRIEVSTSEMALQAQQHILHPVPTPNACQKQTSALGKTPWPAQQSVEVSSSSKCKDPAITSQLLPREQAETFAQSHISSLSVNEIKICMNLHHLPDDEIRLWQAWVKAQSFKPLDPKLFNNSSRIEVSISAIPPEQRMVPIKIPIFDGNNGEDTGSPPIILRIDEDCARQIALLADYRKRLAQMGQKSKPGAIKIFVPNPLRGQFELVEKVNQLAAEIEDGLFKLASASPEVGTLCRPPKPLQDSSTCQDFNSSQAAAAFYGVISPSQRPATPDLRHPIRLRPPPLISSHAVSSYRYVREDHPIDPPRQVDTLRPFGTSQPGNTSEFEYHVTEEEPKSRAASSSHGVHLVQGSDQNPPRGRPRSHAVGSSERPGQLHVTDPFEDLYPPPIRVVGTDTTSQTDEEHAAEIESDVEMFRKGLQARTKSLTAYAKAQIEAGKLGDCAKAASRKWSEQEARLAADIESRVQQYKEMCYATRIYENAHTEMPGFGEVAQKHLGFLDCDEAEKIRRAKANKLLREDPMANPPTEEEIAAYRDYEREMSEDYEAGLDEGLEPAVAAKKAAKKQAKRQAAVYDGIEDQIRKAQELREKKAAEMVKIKEGREHEREATQAAVGKKANKLQKKGKSGGRRRK